MIPRLYLSNWRMEMGKTEKSRFGARVGESKYDIRKVRFEMHVRYKWEMSLKELDV